MAVFWNVEQHRYVDMAYVDIDRRFGEAYRLARV
jgi:hypothetical protein